MCTFGVCSIWHLAVVSVMKCSVIVRPLTHFTTFTDRVLKAIICTMWILSLAIGGSVSNVGVTGAYVDWVSMMAYVKRRSIDLAFGFGGMNFLVSTVIIMIAYIKVFLAVRRQVRSMPPDVLGSFGSRTIFGSSVRSAKNLFVMCAAYYLAYLPVMIRIALRARSLTLPDTVEFAVTWIYISSAALNGFLYIALHSSVRRELRRYLPRCRHRSVVPALTQAAGVGGVQRSANAGVGASGAPVAAMTSSRQRATQRLPTAVL